MQNSGTVQSTGLLRRRATAILVMLLAMSAVATAWGRGSQRGSHSSRGYRSHAAHSRGSHLSSRHAHRRMKRSARARDAFKHQQPCPATRRRSGVCPGYVIDHVRPLECGGADAPSNMQWQTVAAAKAKDKTERSCR
jgi:hypothetical protein